MKQGGEEKVGTGRGREWDGVGAIKIPIVSQIKPSGTIMAHGAARRQEQRTSSNSKNTCQPPYPSLHPSLYVGTICPWKISSTICTRPSQNFWMFVVLFITTTPPFPPPHLVCSFCVGGKVQWVRGLKPGLINHSLLFGQQMVDFRSFKGFPPYRFALLPQFIIRFLLSRCYLKKWARS